MNFKRYVHINVFCLIFYVHLFRYFFVCLSFCLSVCFPVCLSVCVSVCLFSLRYICTSTSIGRSASLSGATPYRHPFNRRPVSSVGRAPDCCAPDCCAGGRRFKPRPDQHSRVGAPHRVNLMHLSPLDRNVQENYYD